MEKNLKYDNSKNINDNAFLEIQKAILGAFSGIFISLS
tara:strand:- start:56 stop:169 length:114 start_codon:yes stop_codon:yes gene_type:complete